MGGCKKICQMQQRQWQLGEGHHGVLAFNAIKDAERYLTGEGGAGADNNNGCSAAINAPSTTKDTEVV